MSFTLNPNFSKIFIESALEISKPISFLKLDKIKLIFLCLYVDDPEILIFPILPPQISCINFADFINPSSKEFGSTPLSNRYLASVIIPSSFEDFVIEVGSKLAASITTLVVFISVPLNSPPKIPPSPRIFESSAITQLLFDNVYFLPSKA